MTVQSQKVYAKIDMKHFKYTNSVSMFYTTAILISIKRPLPNIYIYFYFVNTFSLNIYKNRIWIWEEMDIEDVL